jgi:WD40 repeat protein
VYYSGVVFMPRCQLYELIEKSIGHTVQLLSPRHSEWGLRPKIIEGHEGVVTSVAFSPDNGSRIVSGSDDTTVRIWDTSTGEALATLNGHDRPVASVAFSPDGSRIVSGSTDHTVRIWDTSTGEALATLEGHEREVRSVAFSPDGSRIVSGSYDKTVRIWDTSTGEALTTLEGHEESVTSVAFSPDGSRIISRSSRGKVLHWDAITGSLLSRLVEQETQIEAPSQPIFECEQKSGWLWLKRRSRPSRVRLCWIPFERRPSWDSIESHGGKVVMGSKSGIITILDCSLHPSFH